MSDRRAGWIIVIVSAALAIFVCLLAFAVVAQGALQDAANTGEAAIALLIVASPGILTVVALDVIAIFMSKDLWVRVVAASVAVLTILGVLLAGGIAAERTDPPASAYWAAAGYAPGPFDCATLNDQTPPEMQAALDELDHPGKAEIYFAANDSCAAMLDGVPPAMAIGSYLPQLEREGWKIEESSDDWLRASRSGYQLWVVSCWPDPTESAVVIFADRYRFGIDCDDSTR